MIFVTCKIWRLLSNSRSVILIILIDYVVSSVILLALSLKSTIVIV